MEGDLVLRYELDEIVLRVAGEGGFAEMPVVRQEGCRARMKVGEIAAPSTGDPDFLSRFCSMVEDQDRTPAPTGNAPAHQAGGPDANDHNVSCFLCHNTRPSEPPKHHSGPSGHA